MSRKWKVPHTLVLLFAMIVAAQLFTYLLPAGTFARVEVPGSHNQRVVPGSYTPLEEAPLLPPLTFLTQIPPGFAAAHEIIFFVFIIGGALALLRRSGAIDGFLGLVLRRLGHRPSLLLGGGMLLFCVGSSTIGMAEEYLPFAPVMLALCAGLGLDPVTAVGTMCMGYAIGYGTAVINPFTLCIAQDIAGLEITSGAFFRVLATLPFLALGFLHLHRHIKRTAKETAATTKDTHNAPGHGTAPLTPTHGIILGAMAAALVLLVWGIKEWDWLLPEMGALFLGLALVTAVVGRIGPSEVARTFCAGAAELTTTALLIGFARTIQLVLEQGKVIDTIIQAIAAPLESLGAEAAAVGMLAVQSICNLFIPSGSGQAYVTMPIMAPLADMVGVERQVAVLAYQLGDGLTNIVVPTNAVLVGILAMAGIPFERWLRFILPFMLQAFLLGALTLVAAVAFGLS